MNVRDTRQRERHIRPRITDSAIGEFDHFILNGNDLTIKDITLFGRNENGLIDKCFQYGRLMPRRPFIVK